MKIKTSTNCWRKGFLWVCVLNVFYVNAFANNYYFSTTDGDDSRSQAQAQNSSTPWRSIEKLNAFFSQLNPGDNVFFKAGDVFYGSILVSKSGSDGNPISFTSYGNGAKPQITGFTAVTGWSNVGAKIWEANVPAAQQKVNSVLVDNTSVAPGRYPNADAANSGYLNFETAIGNTSIIDLQLSGFPNWTGGEVVIRKNRWVLDRNSISLHIGNIINYASQSNYGTSAGYGYFIQNHPAALDKEGEWYYRSNGQKFGLYNIGKPSEGSVKVSTLQKIVSIDGKSNITFHGLSFTGANENAFTITNSQNIQIKNCDILYTGVNAIVASSTSGLSVEGNTINFTNNVACLIQYCSNLLIKNNSITNTGTVAGMGSGDSGSYQGLVMSGENQLIEGNVISNTGYVPISFGGNNVVVKNNLVEKYAFVKDDGGGIYTWNNSQNPPARSGQVISGNIVLNGLGAGDGTPDPDKHFAQGIYMDDNAAGVEINGNTVASCNGYGLFIHNAHDLVIKNNTAFNNTVQLEMSHDDVAPIPITNVTLTGNTFVSKLANQSVAEFKTNGNDINNFGYFDNNYYSRPLYDYMQIGVLYKENGSYKAGAYSVDGWKTLYGKDQNSKASPFSIEAYKVNNLIGNNLFANGSFNSNINGLYAYSSGGNTNTAWNNGTLDGGALQINFPWLVGNGNKATVIIGVGNIAASKNYVLKFSIKGANDNKALDAYLRQSGAPYADITSRKSLPITGNRTDYEILLTPTANENNASIGLDIPEQTSSVYIDNIQLTEANVTMTNPDDSIRFVYNASASGQSFPLNGSYADIANNNYAATINLTPYASAVLLKKSADQPIETANCQATGVIVREQWNDITGNSVGDIPVQAAPSSTSQLTLFEAPSNTGDYYGARIRGYICPPQTGNYTFWIASDDESELWLSTDDNSANKTKIAYLLNWTDSRQYNKYASQKSASIYLQAGHKYYIEALHKEGNGGDNLSVAWKLPNGTMEAPIAGSRLSPFVTTPLSSQTITFSALGTVTLGVAPLSLTATASSGLPISYNVVSGPATVAGNLLTVTGVGNVVIQAVQEGNATYNAATPVTQNLTVLAILETANCTGTGTITREQWNNIAGNDVASIPTQTAPSSISQLTLFEAPINAGNNYGARVRGYICPPQTGNYIFSIASDDASELWLSTDDNPANKVKIAYLLNWTDSRQYDKYASQKSVSIYLKTGYRYYIEALHKEGAGNDNLSVAWQLPNGTQEAPIPGNRLSPFVATTLVDVCEGSGSITREQWSGVGGNDVSNIPTQTTPNSTSQLTLFEAPSNIGNNYGARVRGYICPPQTGNYTFWIAADDASELWLSTNDDPNNKVKIAYNLSWTESRQYDKYASQKSVSIYLKTGYRYYIEALHKDGSGSDNLSVAWQLPDGTQEGPIPGNRLIPFSTGSEKGKGNIVKADAAANTANATPEVVANTTAKLPQSKPAVNQLTVSPNLIHSSAVIEAKLKESGKIKIDLIDQQGRIVKQVTNGLVTEQSLIQRFQLYTAGLGSGMYLVRLVTQSGILTQKIVIEK